MRSALLGGLHRNNSPSHTNCLAHRVSMSKSPLRGCARMALLEKVEAAEIMRSKQPKAKWEGQKSQTQYDAKDACLVE